MVLDNFDKWNIAFFYQNLFDFTERNKTQAKKRFGDFSIFHCVNLIFSVNILVTVKRVHSKDLLKI